MQHYEKDPKYTFRGRADQIKTERQRILNNRWGEEADLYEHVVLLSTTVEALLVAFAKMLEESPY